MFEPYEDRLREATVEPQGMDFAALRAAAAKASTQLTPERALAMIRLAHRKDVPEAVVTDFVSRLNAEGTLVADEGQGQLVSMLAVEALISLFSRNVQNIGIFSALAVRCAGHAKWRSAHPDLTSSARAFLSERSGSVRERYPLGASLSKERPKHESGTVERAEEEVAALREVVRSDRSRSWEREQLAWWLLSETRPPTAFAFAQSFNFAIFFVPEPPATDEMLKAKLQRNPGATTMVPSVSIPPQIGELCPALLEVATDPHRDPEIPHELPADQQTKWIEEIRQYLDELLLVRAFNLANG